MNHKNFRTHDIPAFCHTKLRLSVLNRASIWHSFLLLDLKASASTPFNVKVESILGRMIITTNRGLIAETT